jgi:hypothetical protein
MALNTKKLEEYADIYLQRKYHRDKDNELTEKLVEMEQSLLDHMADEGANKISLVGGKTLSVQEQIWPEYGTKDVAIAAIRAAKIPGMLEEGFNHQRLAGFLRELIRRGKELPKEFKGKIKAKPVQKLIAKKL